MRPRASQLFHVMLLGALLPLLSLPFVVAAALWAHKHLTAGEDRVWLPRIRGLVLVDLLMALAVAALLYAPTPELAPNQELVRPRIGVRIDEESGAVRVHPLAGSPADQAGMESGDEVVSVGGVSIASADDLQEAVVGGGFEEQTIVVSRGGERIELRVEPKMGARAYGEARPGAQGLFTPAGHDDACFEPTEWVPSPTQLVFYGLALLVFLGLVVTAVKLGVGAGFLLAFLGVFAASTLTSMAVQIGGCEAMGGVSPGLGLVALLAQGAVMLGLGYLLMRREPSERLLPPLPASRAYAQSLFYAMVWLPRTFLLALGARATWMFLVGQTGTPIDVFLQSDLGVLGAGLFLFAGAMWAPVAEEVLFRGGLLPHLGRMMSPWAAILSTGILFGLLHVQHGMSLIGPLTLGVIFGWARAVTGSLTVPIALHISFNALSLLTLLMRGS